MFENLKLKNQCRESAQAVEAYKLEKAAFDRIFQETKSLQPGIESAWLAYFACERTEGDPDRINELKLQYLAKLSEKKIPRANAGKKVADARDAVEKINVPVITLATRWFHGAMQVDANREFAEYCLKASSSIERMRLEPLEKIIAAVKPYKEKIENWTFAKPLKNPIPVLRLQDVFVNA
jgi:hypothetical protein